MTLSWMRLLTGFAGTGFLLGVVIGTGIGGLYGRSIGGILGTGLAIIIAALVIRGRVTRPDTVARGE